MTSYQSMKSKLEPLGLYRLDSGDVVDCELMAYAAGLDPMFEQFDVMEREAFIPTAESYGLSARERFLERERSELTAAQRRERLIALELGVQAEPTLEGFTQFLSDCGLESFSVSEYPTRQRFSLAIDDELTAGEKALMEQKLKNVMPVHLNLMVAYHDGSTVTL